MIIVQYIGVDWSKRSRGMPMAAIRNNVPKALPLPKPKGDPLDIFRHSISASEPAFSLQKLSDWCAFTPSDHTQFRFDAETKYLHIYHWLTNYFYPNQGYSDYSLMPKAVDGRRHRVEGKWPYHMCPPTTYPEQTDNAQRGMQIMTLKPGQTGRFLINERFAYSSGDGNYGEGPWYYRLHVYNYHYAEKLEENIFIEKPFDKIVDKRAQLF